MRNMGSKAELHISGYVFYRKVLNLEVIDCYNFAVSCRVCNAVLAFNTPPGFILGAKVAGGW